MRISTAMEEFQNLNWSWRAHASDVDLNNSYHLDVQENAKSNLADVFHCHLMQIEPMHLNDYYQKQKARTAEQGQKTSKTIEESVQRTFADPRTQITIPTFTCDYRDVDLAAKNILLGNCHEPSKLSAAEHSACLNAINKLKVNDAILTSEDKTNRLTYFATIQRRFDEKKKFLAFLKRHYFQTLSQRYHSVPPAIDAFIVRKWKRQLLELYASTTHDAYRISTALKINRQIDDEINVELMHQSHYGNVSRMLCHSNILRQSCDNLLNSYQHHRNERFIRFIREKTIEIADEHQVNAIVPLSVIKILISDFGVDWSVRLTVKDAASSTILNPNKEIAFEKPLPPVYLSGNQRKVNGNKYILRATVCPRHAGAFTHSTKTAADPTTHSDQVIEHASTIDNIQYKLHAIDEIGPNDSIESDALSGGNVSFRIWNLSNGSDKIRLMVPAKTDAFRKGENDVIEMVNLSSKLEFQAEYGAEVMTKTQLLREWCHQYFRPDSITVRFRCDVESGQIIKTETPQLDEIEANLRNLYGVERKTLLKYLWASMQTFLGFPTGKFLLRHNRIESNMIKVYQKCDETDTSITLQSIYEKISFEKSHFDKIDWHPIDEQLVTDIHRSANVLPCAFPPVIVEAKSKAQNEQKSMNVQRTMEIKPQDDSLWVAQQLQNRKTKIEEPELKRKKLKNAAKRNKLKVKLLLRKSRKNVLQLEANELASLKEISVDEYTAVDKSITPTPITMATSERRLTRKRASENFTTEKTKPIDIVNAQNEILKRRAPSLPGNARTSMPSPNGSTSEASPENGSMVTTRSGRVLRSSKQ